MKRLLAALAALLLLSAAGCAEEEHSKIVLAMDTVMELTVYGGAGEEGIARCEALLEELEGLLSVTDPGSAVYALNESGALAVPEGHLAALLDRSLELGERTGGAFDFTIRPAAAAWGFTGEAYRVPDGPELAALLELVDYSAVEWDGTAVSLPEGGQADFGGVAKGYAGQIMAEELRTLGVTSALLNLGGNVQAVGSRPGGGDWRIAVRDPASPESGSYLGVVSLPDGQAAVTSGGYERYFEEGGQIYWHILDPETGAPARSGLVSVTVVGEDGALCDGLSTALFVMGLEEALDHWRAWRDFEAILVGEDGTVTVTAGLAERFELTGEGYVLAIAE